MSKRTNKRAQQVPPAAEPSAASLREMPEVDFSKYRVRRNPFAARVAREGIRIVHHGPSAASLREIPEVDFSKARVRPNPYVTRAAEPAIQYGRGRPRRGEEVGSTTVRSLRLPEQTWNVFDAEATARKTTAHALLRELVVQFVTSLPPRR
ncbi:hypothetical protein BH11MYX2_BH11MYX2_16620 [soil metagenome]